MFFFCLLQVICANLWIAKNANYVCLKMHSLHFAFRKQCFTKIGTYIQTYSHEKENIQTFTVFLIMRLSSAVTKSYLYQLKKLQNWATEAETSAVQSFQMKFIWLMTFMVVQIPSKRKIDKFCAVSFHYINRWKRKAIIIVIIIII